MYRAGHGKYILEKHGSKKRNFRNSAPKWQGIEGIAKWGRIRTRGIRIAAAFVTMLLFIGAGNAFGEEGKFTSSTYGDWELLCPKEKDSKIKQPCRLVQQIVNEETKTPILIIAFGYGGNPASLHAILRLPIGIALPPGISIQIDKNPDSKWQFNHCEPSSCLVMTKISPQLRKRLQAGNKANISFHALGGQKVTVPASLRGISAGLKALEK